ncbi:MAG: IreB family regulatory phosphoprotein [Clostridiales bacterium]|nr:IreB family regulatory phosphoprotein [Clostridiales bacterium]
MIRKEHFTGVSGLDSEITRFTFNVDKSQDVKELMTYVLNALKEKGYNPINQLVGYFISGDPTYITSYKGARGVIKRIDRDELLEVIISEYCSKL